MAEGDVIQNVNPRPAATQPTGAAPKTKARAPAGPVVEQRKVAAAQKAGMIVDARLHGVKPAALAKYINDMIKPSAYHGIAYNKTMLSYARLNTYFTKAMSTAITGMMKQYTDYKKTNASVTSKTNTILKTISVQQKDLATKPTKTTEILTEIVKGNAQDRQQRIYAQREAQKNVYDPADDPIHKDLEVTNAELKKLIAEGAEEIKEGKKKDKGGMGKLPSNLLDMIPKDLLVPAAIIAGAQIIKAVQVGLKAIDDMASARKQGEIMQQKMDAAAEATTKRLIDKGRSKEDAEAFEKAIKEYQTLGSIEQRSQGIFFAHNLKENAIKAGVITQQEAKSMSLDDVRKRIRDEQMKANEDMSRARGVLVPITAAPAPLPPPPAGWTGAAGQATPAAAAPAPLPPPPAGWTGAAGQATPAAAAPPAQPEVTMGRRGGRVTALSPQVKDALAYVSGQLGITPDILSKEIDFESDGKWDPLIKNPNSSARGLIQFTDSTAQQLGYKNSLDLVTQNNTVAKQLRGPVLQYLKKRMGKTTTDQGLMMSVFSPFKGSKTAAVDTVLSEKVRKVNPGIDTINDYMQQVYRRPNLFATPASQNVEGASIANTKDEIGAVETARAADVTAQQAQQTELLKGIYDSTKASAEKDLTINTTANAPSSVLTH